MKNMFKNKKLIVFILLIIIFVLIFIFYKKYEANKNIITQYAGEMVYPRFHHSTVRLNDGKILTIGGRIKSEDENNYGFVSTGKNEIYDPETQKSYLVGDYDNKINRSDYTTTLLSNGKVLIAGGSDTKSKRVNVTELFNPKTQEFRYGSKMKYARTEHTATSLSNGDVLFIGGCKISSEIYKQKSNKFVIGPKMIYPRTWRHSAILMKDGRVLIVGGGVCGNKSGDYSNKAEIYDPIKNKFYSTGDLNINRGYPETVLLNNGRVLILEGEDYTPQIEIYNPKTGKFSIVGNLEIMRKTTPYIESGTNKYIEFIPEARSGYATIVLPNGKVLIIGGFTGLAWQTHSLKEIIEFDPKTNKIKVIGNMIYPRTNPTVILLEDKGGVLILGGSSKKTIEFYKY